MITLLILIADMWYYMFTGNSFLYYGDHGIMVMVYIFVGMIFTYMEFSALAGIAQCATERAIEHQRKLNELNTKNMWGKK